MRIGILPNLNAHGGGVYQYSMTMLSALREAAAVSGEVDGNALVILATDTTHPGLPQYADRRWPVEQVHPTPFGLPSRSIRRLRTSPLAPIWRWVRRQIRHRVQTERPLSFQNSDVVHARPEIGARFRRLGINWVLYPGSDSMSFESGIPYVMAIHDLQHRLQPEFPEVSANGEWDAREYLFRNGTRHATLILADSDIGKDDILQCYESYGITPDQVKVLPFVPPPYLFQPESPDEAAQVRAEYDLPDRYFFYPAQFWPHKNHGRLISALAQVKAEHQVEVHLVLVGSHSGDLREQCYADALTLAHRLGVAPQVRHIGYVRDEAMVPLYRQSAGLVMPTFFGPTNIPVLEAWALGRPVLTSDIRGIREQVGDAAVLVDPRCTDAIADGLHRLWTDQQLQSDLAARGRDRLSAYTPADYRRRLLAIMAEASARVGNRTRGWR